MELKNAIAELLWPSVTVTAAVLKSIWQIRSASDNVWLLSINSWGCAPTYRCCIKDWWYLLAYSGQGRDWNRTVRKMTYKKEQEKTPNWKKRTPQGHHQSQDLCLFSTCHLNRPELFPTKSGDSKEEHNPSTYPSAITHICLNLMLTDQCKIKRAYNACHCQMARVVS